MQDPFVLLIDFMDVGSMSERCWIDKATFMSEDMCHMISDYVNTCIITILPETIRKSNIFM